MTSPSRRSLGHRRWLAAGALCPAHNPPHPSKGNRLRTSLLRGIAALLPWLTLALAAPPSFAQPPPLAQMEATTQPLLQHGDRGPSVKQLQQELAQRRFYQGSVDGIYGTETVAAVRSLQRQQGLTVDGVAGAETWQAIASQAVVVPLPATWLRADMLTLTPLVVAAPPAPPSALWLALMPLVPVTGGLLAYLRRQFQRRQQLRRRSQRRLPR